jgi:hypothetical protein
MVASLYKNYRWARAKVVEYIDPYTVTVLFLDYGNLFNILIRNIRNS